MDKNRDTHLQIKKMQRGILSSHIAQTSNGLEVALWKVGKHGCKVFLCAPLPWG